MSKPLLTSIASVRPEKAIRWMLVWTLGLVFVIGLNWWVFDQIASAIDLIIFVERMRDGSRKVTYVTEVQGMEGDTIVLQDIFVFEQLGIDENGRVVGRQKPVGIRPKFIERIENAGIHLPPEIFGVDRLRPW